jgi:hypothetical protein
MRKLVALMVLLGSAGWTLADADMLARLSGLVERTGLPACEVARAEPLCPLC